MSTKIGLISDIHADAAYTEAAFAELRMRRVDQILCAGDVAGYGDELPQTVQLLRDNSCDVICGNHDMWYDESKPSYSPAIAEYLHDLPAFKSYVIEETKVYMVHAEPPDACMGGIKLLDEHGCMIESEKHRWSQELVNFDYDVLIIGHTHQVFAEQLAKTLVINPGSTKFNYCCAVLTLPDMAVDFIPLRGRTISRVWNWGEYRMRQE